MSEQRFGAGGIPLRPLVAEVEEEPKVVKKEPAPTVEYKTTLSETDSEELPAEVEEAEFDVLEIGSKQ